MTARILLVRHGAHDRLGRILCGRMEGVALNAAGHAQARHLATVLPAADEVFTSPQPRAWQTATPIAGAVAQIPQCEPALDEIAMGDWTGAVLADLALDARWAAWNSDRLHHRPPGGESMLETQVRMAGWLQRMAAEQSGRTVIAVSHADVIKAACCHVLGLSVDCHARFDVDAGSVTTLLCGTWGVRLVSLNGQR